MAHVIVEEGLYDAEYVKEQTDLPFLVRDDNGRFLRECDVVEGGADDQFYFWNAAKGRKQLATGTWGSELMTIALDEETDPALEGAHRVRLVNGKRVRVRPVFELLRARLAEYTPERAAEITGVPAKQHPLRGARAGGGPLVDDLRLVGRLQALLLRPVSARDGLPDGAHRQLAVGSRARASRCRPGGRCRASTLLLGIGERS